VEAQRLEEDIIIKEELVEEDKFNKYFNNNY
jgi:hypothetical protein